MSFEEKFFGEGNRLRWDAIATRSLPRETQERLAPFLDDLRRRPEFLVLPRVNDDGRVMWYVLCGSGRVLRMAKDEVRAFVGPSYSDFEGQSQPLDANDPVDAAVLEHYGRNAFRFEVPREDDRNRVRDRLRLLIKLRDERPPRHAREPRATGRVLRDFEYALLLKDATTASECIAELRQTGRLSAVNLLFLEVRRLAAIEQWPSIMAMPELGSLVAMRRPTRVTEALVSAVYQTRLADFENRQLPSDAMGVFARDIFPRYRELYATRAGLLGGDVAVSFMLVAATSTPARRDVADDILNGFAPDARRPYLEALADLIPQETARASRLLDDARAAFAAGDVDLAYEAALRLPASVPRCALLVRCAREMGTLEAARVALRACDELSADDQLALRSSMIVARSEAALLELTAPVASPDAREERLPASWADWLRRLIAEQPWRSAVPVAEVGSREWPVDTLLRDPQPLAETAELLLAERPEWGQVALRDAMPFLLDSLLAHAEDPALRPMFENLFLTIAVDDQVSRAQFASLCRVADARIQLGVNASEYKAIVEQLAMAMESVGSPSVVDAALDVADMLISAPCASATERQQFLMRVSAFCQRWFLRIGAAQWKLLRRFGAELGLDEVGAPPPESSGSVPDVSEWAGLEDRRVAFYSLRESALRHADATLRELCPRVQVSTFHDHVGGSPALKSASATADIFVVATAAAKHAATQFIESNRPKDGVTLYARGQGSASLLEAVREHLRVSERGQ